MSAANSYDLARLVLQKISCILSGFGSVMIISSISHSEINLAKPQQRLLIGISCSDLITSITWIFTNLFMPPTGNTQTCNAQGFLVQFGISSGVLFMVALQVQYLLTIKFGWAEKKIKKIEWILLTIPLAFALGTSISALKLDLYNPADWDCWIAPFPDDCTESYEIKNGHSDLDQTDCTRGDNAQIYQWAFFFAPLWLSIGVCMQVMYLVIKSIKKVEEKTAPRSLYNDANTLEIERPTQSSGTIIVEDSSRRERFPRHNRPKLALTARVRKQCIFYGVGFFVVWTFPTLARFIQLVGGKIHPIMEVFSAFFLGSQGIWNAVIFFRPKYNNIKKNHWWEKVWILFCSTLLCCFVDVNEMRRLDSAHDSATRQSIRNEASVNKIDVQTSGETYQDTMRQQTRSRVIEEEDKFEENEGDIECTS